MTNKILVMVHFIDGEERLVPAKDMQFVEGTKGDRRAKAVVDGHEVPIYNRVSWGHLWYEQDLSRRT